MSLPRLFLSKRQIALRFCRNSSFFKSKHQKEIFDQLNYLCSAGKWDLLNHQPKMLLMGTDKEIAMNVWRNMLPEGTSTLKLRKSFQITAQILTYVGIYLSIVFGAYVYELYVPEQVRYKYKYRKRHGDDHH